MIIESVITFWALFAALLQLGNCQVDLRDYFGNCQQTEETFDACVKDGLNALRPFFKSGLPDYNIAPCDPFFAESVAQKRQLAFFSYKLELRNVTESGWTASQITDFKSDQNRRSIKYTQFFPDKRLNGWYEIEGTFFGQKITNSGSWNLGLFDYVQTTTVTQKQIRDVKGEIEEHPPLKVNIELQTCKNLKLHIGNLLGGRTLIENLLDWVINNAWQPGFLVLKPLINDLVSTAFTEIFNTNFRNFNFKELFSN